MAFPGATSPRAGWPRIGAALLALSLALAGCAPAIRPADGGDPCGAGRTSCGRVCVDLQQDGFHCGACSRRCTGGMACARGLCACPAGTVACSGACVSLLTTAAHCGACGRACGGDQTCVEGACRCFNGDTACGRACVDLHAAADHCGSCDVACDAGAVCVWGRCVRPCPEGRFTCDPRADDTCETDVSRSADHCGRCGHRCGEGHACVNVLCACTRAEGCPAPPRTCADSLDTLANCGACGVACSPGEHCAWGVCGCPPGQTRCGERCVDLQTSRLNCGVCHEGCAADSDCAGGRCVPREAPRLFDPPSGAVVATPRPALRWLPSRGAVGASVALCADRTCARPLATIEAAGAEVEPPGDLPSSVVYWRVRERFDGGRAGTWSATWEMRVRARPVPGGGVIGHFVDVNGDGFADVVRSDARTGRVCLHLGSTGGLGGGRCPELRDELGLPLRGVTQRACGDFDGDGFTDVAVLAVSRDRGRVFLLGGGPTGLSAPREGWRAVDAWPLEPNSALLHEVGDLDRDGRADLALSHMIGNGRVVSVFPAAPSRLVPLHVFSAPSGSYGSFGDLVAAPGDLDADGHGDLLISARSRRRDAPVLVYPTGALGLPSAPTMTVRNNAALTDESVGFASFGDFNGDGVSDVLLASASQGLLYRGRSGGFPPSLQVALPAPHSGVGWGETLGGARDFNGDGYADLVVLWGATAAPEVVLLPGAPSGVVATAISISRVDVRAPPVAVLSSVGDVNHDGFDDLLVATSGELLVYHGSAMGFSMYPSQRPVLRVADP